MRGSRGAEMAGYVRQAVVVIHGMGEQLPLDTLRGFIDTALEPDEHGNRRYYSRPESVTGSYESRRFLAPRVTWTVWRSTRRRTSSSTTGPTRRKATASTTCGPRSAASCCSRRREFLPASASCGLSRGWQSPRRRGPASGDRGATRLAATGI
jgi:hypothetical protein